MPTPNEVISLISGITPETIERFCRMKFPSGQFDRCGLADGGFFRINYSEASNPNDLGAPALRQFLDLTVDGSVQVIGRFTDAKADLPTVIYSVPLKGSITSRSSRKKQADFARFLLNTARTDLGRYRSDWSHRYTTALFFFYDEAGNFRMSLIESEEKRFRRFTFFVEHDTSGTKNRTFRYRMTNAKLNEKAVRGEMAKWTNYQEIKEAFSVEALTKEFYQNLFAWYERACNDQNVFFPNNIDSDADNLEKKNEHLIRLITRLMFVWFIKHKHLVPETLFDKDALKGILKSFDLTKGDNYYRAILQNLFFATLNSEIPDRAFANEGSREEKQEHFDIKTLYRYGAEFSIPEADILSLFRSIPFLNGGLFECLDRGKNYFDGFSRNSKQVAHIPNAYFFDEREEMLGLIPLLNRYNFTVDENAPGDEDVALDPELLGKVFENLLGAFNPETKVAARNATGSFYTPREIVNYMVDESLIAHLSTKCGEENAKTIRNLFTDGVRPADEELCTKLDQALVTAKILDPACGSGAFPMGILLRMVELLRILRKTPEDETLYDLKLKLIENCIYGGDIQCIAVQISKLRFFISLVCEQKPTINPDQNYGINPLPNLETKFVAADSLVGLKKFERVDIRQRDMFSEEEDPEIKAKKAELWEVRNQHFRASTHRQKRDLRATDNKLRKELAAIIRSKHGYTVDDAEKMSAWDPYDQSVHAEWSNPGWMFNVKDGFDVVIGNPPYGANIDKILPIIRTYYQDVIRNYADSFKMFFQVGLHLAKRHGIITYICPNVYLSQPRYKDLRQYLLRSRILRLVNLGDNVFDEVVVPVCLSFIANEPAKDIYLFADLADGCKFRGDLNSIQFNEVSIARVASFNDLSLFQSEVLKNNQIYFDDALEIKDAGIQYHRSGIGLKNKGGNDLFERLFSAQPSTVFSKPVWYGKLINRYWISDQTDEFFNLGHSNTLKDNESVSYTQVAFEKTPKIIWRQTASRLQATIDCQQHWFRNTIQCAYIRQNYQTQIDPYYLLGVVNSQYIASVYNNLVRESGRVFPQVKITHVKKLPLAVPSKQQQEEVATTVKKVLEIKKTNPTADTSQLEADIDNLVYVLYGLKPEEIAIVEELSESTKKIRKVVAMGATNEATGTPEAISEPPAQSAPKRRGRKREQETGLDL